MGPNFTVDLAQEIRRVDGGHSLGAGALAEALMPFIKQRSAAFDMLKALHGCKDDLIEVIEWALEERAPLRLQELKLLQTRLEAIDAAIAKAGG